MPTDRSGTTRFRHRWPLGVLGLALAVALGAAFAPGPPAASAPALPFGVGEELTYRIRVSGMGTVGTAKMTVSGPVQLRGRETYHLRFDFRTRVGPISAADHTESWLDPAGMTALRFRKQERHPFSSHDESVELFPSEMRWSAVDGRSGKSASNAPLDELSFLYFVRTLPLEPGRTHRFDRHFDSARNPITIRSVKRETIRVGAGEFASLLVEMRVRDPRRYGGEGILRIHLSDDERRLPIRMESAMSVLGTAVLTLESYERPAAPREAAR